MVRKGGEGESEVKDGKGGGAGGWGGGSPREEVVTLGWRTLQLGVSVRQGTAAFGVDPV